MGRKGLLAIVLLSLFIAMIFQFFWPAPHDEHVFLPVEKPVAPSLKIIHPGDQLFIRILKAEDCGQAPTTSLTNSIKPGLYARGLVA